MTTEATYSQAFKHGVAEEMARDAGVFILGTDLFERGGNWAQIAGLGAEVGRHRVLDTPISEAAMVAAGVGAALNGTRPIVDLNFIDFGLGAMDEIVNQAAKIRYMWGARVPLVIRGTAGVAGGGAQHNNSLQSFLAGIPGLAVVFPYRPWDVKGLIKTALRGEDPVVFLMHKRLTGLRGPVGGDDDLVPIGAARLAREGADATVVTYAHGVGLALEAAQQAAAEGIELDVIDLRTLFPLDMATILTSVRKTGRVMVLDEAPRHGSISGEIAARIQEDAFFYLDQPVLRVTGRHTPIPHSEALLRAVIPGVDDVTAGAKQLLAGD
jgi:pyruvate dehydrogenase E1 component beta subunit